MARPMDGPTQELEAYLLTRWRNNIRYCRSDTSVAPCSCAAYRHAVSIELRPLTRDVAPGRSSLSCRS
jgi:hypothetical protein